MNLKSLSLLSLLSLSLTALAGNTKTTVTQVTDGVTITADEDYIITDATPFTTTGSVNIQNTEHAVVIIKSVKPSKVISTWLSHIYINGEPAVAGDLTSHNATAGSNCQVKMYNRGAIIMPYDQNFRPLTTYTEENFAGESCNNYTEGNSSGYMKTLTEATLNNNFKSFKLKRGYMVTFALGTSGWGYSRCFIADSEDLEMNLPANMSGRVSSYRIFKWWNAHKAGLASNGGYEANTAVGSCWCYDWAQGNASNLPDIEWVPNHIYEDYPSSATCGGVTGSCHMKTNNEPGNSSDDHPQSVDVILDNWQNLMRTGLRLCSESSWDGNSGHDIYQFLDSIDKRGWRCDLADLHCYWDSGSFNSFASRYNNLGGRPIWISEWVWGASWNKNGAFASGRQSDDATYSGTVPILEILNSSKYIERYAYWNSEADYTKIYRSGSLTKLGEYYASMDEGLGYDPSIQKIPNVVTVNPTDLTGTYTKSKGSFTLNWNDANGDMLDSVVVQIKEPGSTVLKWHANVALKDINGKTTSYSYVDYPEAGANYYRIAVYPIGNKTPLYSNEASVTVSSAKGTDMYQYGRIAVTNTDAIVTDFSESFSTTPAVFMGIMSNKTAKLYPSNLVKSVSKTKFSYNVQPWTMNTNYLTTVSNQEDIPFLAIQDTTNYKFGDLDCEVGNAKINTKDVLEVTFRNPFPEGVTPVVITELRFSTAPTNGLNVRIFDVTNTGFKAVSMYEEGVGKSNQLNQNISYLAITPGIGELDKENSIIIAAGHGDDLYGSTYRPSLFMEGEDSLFFKNPYIFGALQTRNYPSATILRRQSDLTVSDTEAANYKAAYGTRIKRQYDLTSTATESATTRDYADEFGWIVIANWEEGCSAPTAIQRILKSASENNIKVALSNRTISVVGSDDYEVYSSTGANVAKNAQLTPGIYVVKSNGKSVKVIVK